MRSRNLIATPPGATIREQLQTLEMSQKEFAARMKMSEKHISRLVNGDVQLTPETALKLEMVLGVPASFWNNLEAIYREKVARIAMENELNEDSILASNFPYEEMARRAWVLSVENNLERILNLRKFFGVTQLSRLSDRLVTDIWCREVTLQRKADLAFIAWARQVKLEGQSLDTDPMDSEKLGYTASLLSHLSVESPEKCIPKLAEKLAMCGVALVPLSGLKGMKNYGVTMSCGKRAIVGIALEDLNWGAFWTVLYGELSHIVLGQHGAELQRLKEYEKASKVWIKDTLVDKEAFRVFADACDYSEVAIARFAEDQQLSCGIVEQRLQMERLGKYAERSKRR